MKTHALLAVVLVAMFGCFVAGEDKAVPSEKAEAVVTESYDIRALIFPVPDYPLRKLMDPSAQGGAESTVGIPGPALFPPDNRDRQVLVDPMTKLITTTIAPETWRDAGGTVGALSMMDGMLLVTQTPTNQKEVKDLLAKLGNQHHQTIRIDATWVLLSPAELAAIKRVPGKESIAEVPDELLKAAKVYCRGQVVMFNGQMNHIASTTVRQSVSDLTPVVGANAVAYDPTMENITTGVGLQMRPQLSDGQTVLLDLFNEVVEAPAADAKDLKQAVEAVARPATQPAVDDMIRLLNRPRVIYQTLRTTARIPLGMNVLIGGMTLDPAGKDTPARELYLVIRADADKK